MKRTSLALGDYFHTSTWLPFWSLILAVVAGLILAQAPLEVALALVLVPTFLILSYVFPLVGLGAALVAGPLGAYENIVLGSLPLESGQLLFFVAVAGWLLRNAVRRQLVIHRTLVNISLLIFIAVASLSLLSAVSLAFGIKELVKWLELAVAMMMIVDLYVAGQDSKNAAVRHKELFSQQTYPRLVLAILLLAGLSQALIGIWQFGIRGEGPDHFLILERFYRAFGTFMQPNPYGGFMSITTSLAIGALSGLLIVRVSAWRKWKAAPLSGWIWIGFVAACAVFAGLALLMSWSRGAWLGFGAAMATLIFFLPRRRWQGLLFLALVAVVLVAAFQLGLVPQSVAARVGSLGTDLQVGDVRGEFVTIENYALVERLAHWQAGLDMARENLWSGVGFGGYERAYENYALLNWPFPLGHAHNYYINLLAEVGTPGTAAYLLLWGVIFIQVIGLLRTRDWEKRGIALGLLAAWTSLSIHHLVDKLYVNNMFIYFGVMLGLQQVLDRQND